MKGKGLPSRFAAFDIGSHTIRCLVAEKGPAGEFGILADEERTVPFAAALGEGSLAAALGPARAALRELWCLADALGAARIDAVATGIFRTAPECGDLLNALEAECPVAIRPIGSAEEAALVSLSARRRSSGLEYPLLAADIGGASVEIAVMTGKGRERFHSLDIGAALLTRRFFGGWPREEGAFRVLARHVDGRLATVPPPEGARPSTLIGSGGTFAALAEMTAGHRGPGGAGRPGTELSRRDVERALRTLRRSSRRKLLTFPGVGGGRVDIITAGAAVAEGLMRHFGTERLRFNRGGVAEGVALRGLAEPPSRQKGAGAR